MKNEEHRMNVVTTLVLLAAVLLMGAALVGNTVLKDRSQASNDATPSAATSGTFDPHTYELSHPHPW